MAANKRTLLDNYSRERGSIIVGGQADREVGAGRRPVPLPAHLSPGAALLAGHRLLLLPVGAPYGLEHAADDLLSGDADTLFVRRVTDLLTGRRHGRRDDRADHRRQGAEGGRRGARRQQGRRRRARPPDRRHPRDGEPPAVRPQPALEPRPGQGRQTAWKKLSNDKAKPYLNRAITGDLYPPGSTSRSSPPRLPSSRASSSDENSEVPGPAELDLPLTRRNLPNEDRPGLRAGQQDDAHPRPRDLVQHGLRLPRPRARRRAAPRAGRQVRLRRLAPDPHARLHEHHARRAQRSAGGPVGHRPVRGAHDAAADGHGRGRHRQPGPRHDALPHPVGPQRADLDIIESAPDPVELSQAVSPQTASTSSRR